MGILRALSHFFQHLCDKLKLEVEHPANAGHDEQGEHERPLAVGGNKAVRITFLVAFRRGWLFRWFLVFAGCGSRRLSACLYPILPGMAPMRHTSGARGWTLIGRRRVLPRR